MPLDDIQTGIEDLNDNNPPGSDPKSEGDNHLRDIKKAIRLSFPNTNGPWTTTDEINCGGIDAGNNPVTGVSNPVGQTDAINLNYLQSILNVQRVSWGGVGGSNGGTANSPGSNDFTAQRISTGLYELTFDVAPGVDDFNAALIVSPLTTGLNIFATVETLQGTGQIQRVHTKTVQNSPQYTDCSFYFVRLA